MCRPAVGRLPTRRGAAPEPVEQSETRSLQFFCASLPIVGSLIQATVGSFGGWAAGGGTGPGWPRRRRAGSPPAWPEPRWPCRSAPRRGVVADWSGGARGCSRRRRSSRSLGRPRLIRSARGQPAAHLRCRSGPDELLDEQPGPRVRVGRRIRGHCPAPDHRRRTLSCAADGLLARLQ